MDLAYSTELEEPTLNISGAVYDVVYCVSSATIGAVVGAVVGVGIAGAFMRPEEAVVLVTGVQLGGPLGLLIGLALGLMATFRRRQRRTNNNGYPDGCEVCGKEACLRIVENNLDGTIRVRRHFCDVHHSVYLNRDASADHTPLIG